jgi:hypothetical protein
MTIGADMLAVEGEDHLGRGAGFEDRGFVQE